ncbi:hypothetical protein P170DRAFT_426081 [Aspergillus steynii IBT 23096]|uniref:Uncharacterized protein n=1 Tax=Aspergillus steynii IBT 23096 TaxID=1392250 RepID=A0A2I2G8A9_9EURO|nr:uncharacterized protein P170DRAFT_426081 [Aspergillus steynii IBT 23096]PLB49108.1 hypothetical protein P170DRAFT_426081 [Aspergillus steynii IBT 23096]
MDVLLASYQLPDDGTQTMHVTDNADIDDVTYRAVRRSSALTAKTDLAHYLTYLMSGEAQEESIKILRTCSLYDPGYPGKCHSFEMVANYMVLRDWDDECHHFLRQVSIAFCRIESGNNAYHGPGWDVGRDPLSDNEFFHHPTIKIRVFICLWLLRYKLLVGFEQLQAVREQVGQIFPTELVDMIQERAAVNGILAKGPSLARGDHCARIEDLRKELQELWSTVHRRNPLIWAVLLGKKFKEKHTCKPRKSNKASCRKCQVQDINLKDIIASWESVPGALDCIRRLCNTSGNRSFTPIYESA